MKIRTDGSQAFNVPNDEEGHVFLKLLRKFRNRGWYYRARGRGSRKEHGEANGIEQEHSEWMAVYMSPKAGRCIPDVSPHSVRRAVARALTASFNEHTRYSYSQPIYPIDQAVNQAVPEAFSRHTHPSPSASDNRSAFDFLQSHPTGGGEGGGVQINPDMVRVDPFVGVVVGAAQQAPEDTVELTHAEQAILDRVLCSAAGDVWSEGDQVTVDSLVNKLVD